MVKGFIWDLGDYEKVAGKVPAGTEMKSVQGYRLSSWSSLWETEAPSDWDISEALYICFLALQKQNTTDGWLKQQTLVVLQFWRLDVSVQEASRVGPSEALNRHLPQAPSQLAMVSCGLWHPLACGSFNGPLPSCSPGVLPLCASALCPNFPFL